MEHVLAAILSTFFAINGNQVVSLDCQANALGRSFAQINPSPICSTNSIQLHNYAVLCSILNWNCAPALPKQPAQPSQLRVFAEQYCSAPVSENGLRFLKTYVSLWQTNWEASPTEEGVLKRLSIQDTGTAQAFADKLLANPKNAPYTEWYHWYLLTAERRKEEAAKYAAEHHLDTVIRSSSRYPLAHQLQLRLQIPWPRLAAPALYTYSFNQGTWGSSIVPRQAKPIYIPREWKPPGGHGYRRSWQKGPSWQITYTRQGDWVTRTARYVALDSHIKGRIDGNDLVEDVVEETQAPAGYYSVAPNFVLVLH